MAFRPFIFGAAAAHGQLHGHRDRANEARCSISNGRRGHVPVENYVFGFDPGGHLIVITMKTDIDLLRNYVEDASEEAFAEIVRRHVDLVFGVALRQLGGNAALAQDVTQAVFTALAAKADALQQIHHLAGWLYGTARFTASHTVRAERRRQDRERGAQTMHDLFSEAGPHEITAGSSAMLEAVLDKLNATDREAILLRFYEGQSFSIVGSALRVSEDAARVRVARALEKIRTHFARQGITSSAAAVEAALASQAVAALPALAVSVSATAVASTAALSASAGAKLGLFSFMTTTNTTTWLASAVALVALGISGYESCEASLHAEATARLTLERDNLHGTLKLAEQRAGLLDTRAAQAERKNAELEGKLTDALAAKPVPIVKRPLSARTNTQNLTAEKMAKMKPLLEAGMPIKGAVVLLVDGKPVQRPVEFLIGKETRIESVDDGTYSITPTLKPDGSVNYPLFLIRKDADGIPQSMVTVPSVTQTPWGAFTVAIGGGRVFAFDSDMREPDLVHP
jgi:RNA polymerase sigma factor (sigma-70 family)